MQKRIDKLYAKKRKKLWDMLGFKYPSINYLSKNHSLKCNCSICRLTIYFKRADKKRERLQLRKELKNQLNTED